jgi:hypothetical protein
VSESDVGLTKVELGYGGSGTVNCIRHSPKLHSGDRTVTCRACGSALDPFAVLWQIASEHSRQSAYRKALEKVEEHIKWLNRFERWSLSLRPDAVAMRVTLKNGRVITRTRSIQHGDTFAERIEGAISHVRYEVRGIDEPTRSEEPS